MQHLASNVNLFCKIPSLLNNKSSVAKLSFSTLRDKGREAFLSYRTFVCFYFFPQLFKQIHRFSVEILIDEYFGSSKLVYFLRIFTLSLHLSRLSIIIFVSLSLFTLFCLFHIQCARSISIGHSKQFFSQKTCYSFSSQSFHVSPGVSGIPSALKLFLLDLSSRSLSFCSTQSGSI